MGSNPATPTKKKTLIIKLQTWLSAFSFYSKTPKAIEETTKQAKTKQAQSETLGDCVKILIFAS